MTSFAIKGFVVLLAMILNFTWVAPASATQWSLVAESAQGQTRQYLDLDSIRLFDSMTTANSYFVDATQTDAVRIDYTTIYDCSNARYRDIVVNGHSVESDWRSLASDPLNTAVMDYACQS